MPVPKRKRSKSRRDKRFANKGIAVSSVTHCSQSQCQEPILPHQACFACGFYKGAKIMNTKKDRDDRRKEKRKDKDTKKHREEAAVTKRDVTQ